MVGSTTTNGKPNPGRTGPIDESRTELGDYLLRRCFSEFDVGGPQKLFSVAGATIRLCRNRIMSGRSVAVGVEESGSGDACFAATVM